MSSEATSLSLSSLRSHLSRISSTSFSPVGPDAHTLLSLKPALLLEYTQALSLLLSFQLSGRRIPDEHGARELVLALVRIRLCLERLRAVELRSRPGIERLIRAAEEQQGRVALAGHSGYKAQDEADEGSEKTGE